MRFTLTLFIFILNTHLLSAQSGQWIWMHGNNSFNMPGNYGVKGVPAASNKPAGLYGPIRWTDHEGNFWIFGGSKNSYNNTTDDLWKFNPYTNTWTWIFGTGGASIPVYGSKGVASQFNNPGNCGYGASSWTHHDGSLWMYGGLEHDNSVVWKYDPSTNMWTWMAGDINSSSSHYGIKGQPSTSNTPGFRYEAIAAWSDSLNNMWLFGGYDGQFLNDVWKFDPSTLQWTWMAGDSIGNQLAKYGTMGIPSPTNDPGARCAVSCWKDTADNFYIFGGNTNHNSGPQHAAADLWRFNIHTLEWTWMNGSSGVSPNGNYGPYCEPLNTYYPEGRYEDRGCATDTCGNFLLYAGRGFDADITNIHDICDFWRYNVSLNQWELLSGGITPNINPIYGSLGVASPGNNPGGRQANVAWVDSLNNFWMFGGVSEGNYWFNDMWKFEPDTSCLSCKSEKPFVANFTTSDTSVCVYHCIDFLDLSFDNPVSWSWSFPGGIPNNSNNQNPSQICYLYLGVYDVQLIVSNGIKSDTLLLKDYIHVNSNPSPPTIINSNDTLFSTPAAHYQWYYEGNSIPGAVDSFYVPIQTGTYTVVVSNEGGCTAESNRVVLSVSTIQHLAQFIHPNPMDNFFAMKFPTAGHEEINIVLFNCAGQITTQKFFKAGDDIYFDVSALSSGFYFVRIIFGSKILTGKIVIDHGE